MRGRAHGGHAQRSELARAQGLAGEEGVLVLVCVQAVQVLGMVTAVTVTVERRRICALFSGFLRGVGTSAEAWLRMRVLSVQNHSFFAEGSRKLAAALLFC